MRQVIYESCSTTPAAAEIAPGILRGARPFNSLNGVTGLLCAARNRFLQVLEGPEDSVSLALERIRADDRHHDIEIVSDRPITQRAFGDWAMAFRDEGHPAGLLDERLQMMVARAPREIGDRFRDFVRS